MKSYSEIKDLSVAELNKKRMALSKDLFNARIKNSIGQLANPLEIRQLRRDLARLNTALVQKVAR